MAIDVAYDRSVLAALLPGLREVRPPLTAGVLLLATAFVLLANHLGSIADESGKSESIQRLDDLIGRPVWLGIISIAAYLVGSVFMSFRDRAEREAAAWLTRSLATDDYLSRSQTRFEAIFATFSRPSLRRLGYLGGEKFDVKLIYPVCVDIIFGGGKRLLVSNDALYDEYDRLTSEAAFRDAAAIPGTLALVAFTIELHYSWPISIALALAGLILATLIFVNARQLQREARSMYAHAVADGEVSTSTLDVGADQAGRRRWRLDSDGNDDPVIGSDSHSPPDPDI